MNKLSIKIIKRKEVQSMANVKTQDLPEPKFTATVSGETTERRLHRKMAKTVSNWIAERQKNNRAEEISAIRSIFGSESLSSKTA